MKDIQTEQILCWNGNTDTEHSITSGSNEEHVHCTYNHTKMFRFENLN